MVKILNWISVYINSITKGAKATQPQYTLFIHESTHKCCKILQQKLLSVFKFSYKNIKIFCYASNSVFLGVSMFLIVIMWRKVLQGEILKLNITAWFLSITDTFCFSVVMIGKNGNIPQSHNFWKQWHRSYINTTFRFTHAKDDEWQKSLMTTVKTTLMFVHK